MNNKQAIITKHIPNNKYEYIKYDKDTGHHIINLIIGETIQEVEFDYLETDRELMFHINTVMDDGTSLLIVQTDKVEGTPEHLCGYFIY